MEKPKRRKRKKKRYDFLNKEWIIESDDDAEMDWEDDSFYDLEDNYADHELE